jgi:hypothetical protein
VSGTFLGNLLGPERLVKSGPQGHRPLFSALSLLCRFGKNAFVTAEASRRTGGTAPKAQPISPLLPLLPSVQIPFAPFCDGSNLLQRSVSEDRPKAFSLGSMKSLLGESRNRIKFSKIMGDYKGRVQLRLRKKRSAKNQRIKALADKDAAAPPQGQGAAGKQ